MGWFALGSILIVVILSIIGGVLFRNEKRGPPKLGSLGYASDPRTGILTGGRPENWS